MATYLATPGPPATTGDPQGTGTFPVTSTFTSSFPADWPVDPLDVTQVVAVITYTHTPPTADDIAIPTGFTTWNGLAVPGGNIALSAGTQVETVTLTPAQFTTGQWATVVAAATSIGGQVVYEKVKNPDAGGDLDTVSTSLTFTYTPEAAKPPVAVIDAFPLAIAAGEVVTFESLSTGTAPLTEAWGFPGGTPATEVGPGPHFVTYDTEGQYTATLDVTNVAGADQATVLIDVAPGVAPPRILQADGVTWTTAFTMWDGTYWRADMNYIP